jgi:probable rRNA maturation factor
VVTTSTTVDLPVQVEDRVWNAWLEDVVRSEGRVLGSLTIQWQSDDELLEVNRQFLDHDYYTDIITFNRNRGNRVNGDLAISVDRIIDHAAQQGIAVRDEVLRVVVHGTLHLCGYDDHSDEEKAQMRALESTYMKKAPNFGL